MLRIGPVQLASKMLLAPIAGHTDLAFRILCREQGGVGIAYTDLLNSHAILRETRRTLDLAKTNEFDRPCGMQLYGNAEDPLPEAARWAVDRGAQVVDINMGCPVDKVTKKDGGSALLTNIERAVALAARVAKELEKCPISEEEWQRRQGNRTSSPPVTSPQSPVHPPSSPVPSPQSPVPARFVPLTCKVRLCWHTSDYESGAACSPHLARMLADVGVVAVTVHGRTTEMKFGGVVQLPGIARVVDAVNGAIPIIGNGDVREPIDAERMMRATGCSGVMIGRGALSTPWIFRDTLAHLRKVGLAGPPLAPGEELPPEPTETEKLDTLRRFFDLMRTQRDDRYAIYQINRRVSWFAKRLQRDLGNGKLESIKPFKEAMRNIKDANLVHEIIDRFAAGELRGGHEEPAESLA